jgi:hypothetical protein
MYVYLYWREEFEDTKGVIRIRKSKNRQHNGQKKKVQKDKQRSTKHTYKNKDRITGPQLKISYPVSLLNSEETLETHILTRKGRITPVR